MLAAAIKVGNHQSHYLLINSSLKQYSQNLLFLAHKKFPSKDRAFQMVSKVRSH